ncbi:DUF2997 domain-containing protein [Streptomyces viridochromogenes]|uniref:DUF2997 domain-containing protein n=1 Tax=Streptomyces viridochromogenes TaxID=1938 RepID=UPI000D14A0B1
MAEESVEVVIAADGTVEAHVQGVAGTRCAGRYSTRCSPKRRTGGTRPRSRTACGEVQPTARESGTSSAAPRTLRASP